MTVLLTQSATRIRFHAKRFRGDIIFVSLLLLFYAFMISVVFPEDNAAIVAYSEIITEAQLDFLFTTIGSDAPAWLFWLGMLLGIVLYYALAIIGIRTGARLVPTKEDDSLELLVASSPQSQRRFFLESYLSGFLSLLGVILVSFTVFIAFSLYNDAADTIGRLALVHLFYLLIGVFMMTFSSFFSVIRFNKGSGEKFGYLYLVFAFFLELSASSEEMPEEMLDLSINTYLSPSNGLLGEQWRWNEFGIVLGITLALFILTWWWMKRPEYYERIKPVKVRRIRFLPNFSSQGRLAKRFPLFFDQLRVDRALFFIWTGIVSFFMFYIVYLFESVYGDDPQQLGELVGAFDMPIFDAFTHGHTLDFAQLGYIEFMGFEYYGIMWMYYGLFLLFPAVSAANRDFRRNEQDITWASEVTPQQIMTARTLAIQLQAFLLFTITTFILLAMQSALNVEVNTELQLYAYLVGVVYFIGLGLFLQGFSMLFRVDRGKRYATWFYIISILIIVTAFIATDINDVKFLSLFFYYDAVGIVWGIVSLGEALLTAGAFTAVSALVYFLGLRRYSQSNLS